MVDHPVRSGLRDPERRTDLTHGAVGLPVRGDQENLVLQRQCLRLARATRLAATTANDTGQLSELLLTQPREQTYLPWLSSRHYGTHAKFIPRVVRRPTGRP